VIVIPGAITVFNQEFKRDMQNKKPGEPGFEFSWKKTND